MSFPESVIPQYRYTPELAATIEPKWHAYWEDNKTFVTPNPDTESSGESSVNLTPQSFQSTDDLEGCECKAVSPKAYDATSSGKITPQSRPYKSSEPFTVMDMFPYPSGAGLHVGHPLGYIATDVVARFQRMNGKNVLHALGYDAFGLPAEQYAVQTGQHPRVTTLANIENMKSQLKMLGLAHDPSRTFATIDPEYIRWTQWIFSKIFDSWYDPDFKREDGGVGSARPISELIAKHPEWQKLTSKELSDMLNEFRLAYISESPVNWCPGLGTVLANEEITADGRSERGNFPVFKRNLRQWSMRITAYSDRLDADLQSIDWPTKVKSMQHNWIGKSTGAFIDFEVRADDSDVKLDDISSLRVFTTRPDTIRGATFMVVAPEHDLAKIASVQPSAQQDAVVEYVQLAKAKSAVERQQDAGKKTGVFTGFYGVNPITGSKLPIFIADYVLMGYGTGAIMAVPADDERDRAFAETYNVDIDEGYEKFANIPDAVQEIEKHNAGEATTTYRLRDWLFSRQRYWGEPFPIVFDDENIPHLLSDNTLPLNLPDVPNYAPKTYEPDDENSEPEPPLGRNEDWVNVQLDLGDGLKNYRRETNTMPNWAGSCWYYLRYLNANWSGDAVVDPALDKYWLGANHNSTVGASGGVDLYVGGVEHAVLHLLYARFWHKVLYDLGYVSSIEPFHKLFNQGYVQAYAYTDNVGTYVPAEEVAEVAATGGGVDGTEPVFEYNGKPVNREYGKMGKSLKNVVTPERIAEEYSADTFRVYEMSMGPLELSRPWETRAVVGAQRFLQRLWRLVIDESTGEVEVSKRQLDPAKPSDLEVLKTLHKAIDETRTEMSEMRPNTAIAKLITLCNYLTSLDIVPVEAAEAIVLMTAPIAPHIAEELWQKLGHTESLAYADFPQANPEYLTQDTINIGVQVNGKVRATLTIAATATKDEFEQAAKQLPQIAKILDDTPIKKAIVVPGKIVNFVV